MAKFDIKRSLKPVYSGTAGVFTLIDVPPIEYLAVDGAGDPNTAAAYRSAVEALYSLAYTVKFAGGGSERDFRVSPLEGLWRSHDLSAFRRRDKDAWHWTMLIAQPPWISADSVAAAKEVLKRRKSLPDLDAVRLITLSEGLSAQILHIGPYGAESATLARLHDEYLPEQGLAPRADHHEVYLSDPRRTAPERLKTLLRQPVERIRE